MSAKGIDFERFRVRRFAERLVEIGEADVYRDPVDLNALSSIIEKDGRAKVFRAVGPERVEMVSGLAGSRRRMAEAFGVPHNDIAHEFLRRQANPQRYVEVSSSDAPVHQVVLKGSDIDLSRLPFHHQHELDGGCYISSGLDFTHDPATGRTNVGCRRLMLRSQTTMRSNLTAASDLKHMYLAALKRGERLNVSFVIGAYPTDFLVAGIKVTSDEFSLLATMRGCSIPMVRGVTNNVLVPADAEVVLEGYFDEQGYRELEGPYGEFMGYYGPVHIDPVFHVTAITRRRDAIWQTILHGGAHLAHTDHAQATSVVAEVRCWRALRAAGIEPAAVAGVAATNGRQHVRVAIKRTVPGQARLVIAALHALPFIKAVFVTDDDVDIFDDARLEWAMATRFSADRDLVVQGGYPSQAMDILAGKDKLMTKMGFDLTMPFGVPESLVTKVPYPPQPSTGPARYQTVRQALEQGPMHFKQLVDALANTDARQVAMALEELREEGMLGRTEPDGLWVLRKRDADPRMDGSGGIDPKTGRHAGQTHTAPELDRLGQEISAPPSRPSRPA